MIATVLGVAVVFVLVARVVVVMRRDWRESAPMSRGWDAERQRGRRGDNDAA